MKTISIVLLFFIPIISYGQTFEEIMSINSIDKFKKVVIENGYEFDNTDKDGWVIYGLNIIRDSIEGNKSSLWGGYNKNNGGFTFQFSRRSLLGSFFDFDVDSSESLYDLIVKQIKNRCKYHKISNYKEDDYVTYSCSESSYKGKIGFVVSEGTGIIRHFPPDGDYKKVDKRKKHTELNASKYNLNSNQVGGRNYNLAGRSALSKPIAPPNCEEEGIVVVSIEVDNNGRVVKAVAGIKGTTNSAECLLKPARKAALNTTWNPDPNAPSVQRGTIIYKFSLTQ